MSSENKATPPPSKKRKLSAPEKFLVVIPPPYIATLTGSKIQTDVTDDNLLFLFEGGHHLEQRIREFMKEAKSSFGVLWSQELEDDLYDPEIPNDIFFESYCDFYNGPELSEGYNNGVFPWGDPEVDPDHLSLMVEMNHGKDGVSVPVYVAQPVEGEPEAFGFKWDDESECFLWEAVPLQDCTQ